MANGLQNTADRNSRNNNSEKAGAQLKVDLDESRESSSSPVVGDVGSPYGSTSPGQSYGESVDFGEMDDDLL